MTAIALSSDTPLASEFDCSDPQLNRLYQNVLWTQRANFIDILPTALNAMNAWAGPATPKSMRTLLAELPMCMRFSG